MNKLKLNCLLLAIFVFLSMTVGCSDKVTNSLLQYESVSDMKVLSTQTIDSNSKYELIWEDNAKAVMLKNIKTGHIWSTIPYDFYISGGTIANVQSTLNITIVNTSTLQWETINGYAEAISNGLISAEKVDNALKITYYFDTYKISVPVYYRLGDESMEITVDSTEIREDSGFYIVSMSVAPYLSAAKNTSKDAYLFVPVGSGGLMYTAETSDGIRQFSQEVYGADESRILTEVASDEVAVRLPVFGCKDGNNALLGIIKEGAESAEINAEAGNKRTGYSLVYPTFYVRGYDVFPSESQVWNYQDISRMSAQRSTQKFTVGYYPLENDNADYNGMAKKYASYLKDNNLLKEDKFDNTSYAVTILGGVETTSTVMGMPMKTTKLMTSFEAAKQMLIELENESGFNPYVQLQGFGDNGINVGRIGGGFEFNSIFGKKSARLALEEYCKEKNISLFTDFDIVRYSKSGNGFSYSFDAAKTASLHAAEKNKILDPLRNYDKKVKYKFLKRDLLSDAANKLLDFSKKSKISGVSLSTLGSMAYSDFSKTEYFVKGSMGKDVANIIENINKSGHKVAVSSANDYAAGLADAIFDTPVNDGDYNSIDESIPFYQMVFRGAKALFSPSVNLASNTDKQIMLSAISGSSLHYTLINSFDSTYMETQTGKLYATMFKNNLKLISKTQKTYDSYFTAIANSRITKYEILSSNISKTVFENGVQVYANHSENEADSPVGKLNAYEFKWITGKE